MRLDWKECYEIFFEFFGEEIFFVKWFLIEYYFVVKMLVVLWVFEVDDVYGFGMVFLVDLYVMIIYFIFFVF